MTTDRPASLRQRPSTLAQLHRSARSNGTKSNDSRATSLSSPEPTSSPVVVGAPELVRLIYPDAPVKSWEVTPGGDAARPAVSSPALPAPEPQVPPSAPAAVERRAPQAEQQQPPEGQDPQTQPVQPRESSVPYINAGTRPVVRMGTLRSDEEIDEAVRRLTRAPNRIREQSARGLAEEFDRYLTQQRAASSEEPATPARAPQTEQSSEPLTIKDLEHASITGIGRLAMDHPDALSSEAETPSPSATPVIGGLTIISSPTVVDYDALIAGRAPVTAQVQVDPTIAQSATAQVLEVLDAANTKLGEVIVPLASSVTWNGMAGGRTIPAPGVYKLRVTVRKNGTVIAQSDPVIVKALRLELNVTSAGSTVAGTQTIHPIDSAGPTMPALSVEGKVVGLSADDDAALARDFRLEVAYVQGNRDDHTYVPGPDADGWATVSGSRWQPTWNGFCGDDLIIFCRATVDGTTLERQTAAAANKIWGENPSKATVRAAYGDVDMQVVGHRESRFTQFSDSTSTALLSQERPGPFTVLRSADNGFGIGQLTNSPAPTLDQLWNWQANISDSVRRLRDARQTAINHQVNVQKKHPQAPALTEDELDLEMWCRYNSGSAYHDYDPGANSWVRGAASAGRTYADDLMQVRNDVQNGSPPAGWGTP
jgi:hypothetical protein